MHTRKQARDLLKRANVAARKGLLDAATERAALAAEIDAWRGWESEEAAAAVGDEPKAAERVVAEILDDLRGDE